MDASKSSGKMYEEVSVKHKKVKQALVRFRNLVDELLLHQYKVYQSGNSKVKTKALMEAATLMKREHRWENTEKRVGHILTSVTTFNSVELNVIGLQRIFWRGIDNMGMGWNSLAPSIVVTDCYDNTRKSRDTLVYIGQGGNPNVRRN